MKKPVKTQIGNALGEQHCSSIFEERKVGYCREKPQEQRQELTKPWRWAQESNQTGERQALSLLSHLYFMTLTWLFSRSIVVIQSKSFVSEIARSGLTFVSPIASWTLFEMSGCLMKSSINIRNSRWASFTPFKAPGMLDLTFAWASGAQ